ncbi:MAG: glycosyltransferase family 4 protein [Chthoniobacterales bacterium]
MHYFGRPDEGYIRFAHQKGMKVVVAELHSGLGSRSSQARWAQKLLKQTCQRLMPAAFLSKLAWEAYRDADAFIALTSWEARLMQEMFGANQKKIHVIPNGVEEMFFETISEVEKKNYLVCTATITPRKQVLELAEAATAAGTSLWIIGEPYSPTDPYYLKFLGVVQQSQGLIRYEGGISDRTKLARIYREATGFVLLSTMESLSLSALEAAACGCPLLLSDLPWARSAFGDSASYAPISDPVSIIKKLKALLSGKIKHAHCAPKTWVEVARQLDAVYRLCSPR